ncbi:MAG: hypothetical protein GX298_00280 [Planctomycetes bacterium]|jgi:hypothetical protein|nr:hypothetical protein [Planctomycetota bacterium]
MESINRQSKTTVHLSVQYLLAGAWTPERVRTVEFEKALLDNGLDFSQTQSRENVFTLVRTHPSHLQVKLESPGPQVVTLLVLANNPQYERELFGRDAEAVVQAFIRTWPAEHYQILTVNCKIHHLYSAQTHAFQYLWEERLAQSPEDFRLLGGRPVAGGGLRLIMPPHAVKEDDDPTSIEIRVESFLREPKKVFIETAFTWPKPRIVSAEQSFDPPRYIEQTEQFAANEVWNFLTRRQE